MKRKNILFLCIAVICLWVVVYSKNDKLPEEPVRPKISLHNKKIEFISGESCWFGSEEYGVCSDPPHPDYFYKIIKEKAVVANTEEMIKIKFPIKPDEFYLNVTNSAGDQESIGKADHYIYKLPSKPGYYRYNLTGVWEERNSASYYFGIQIDD